MIERKMTFTSPFQSRIIGGDNECILPEPFTCYPGVSYIIEGYSDGSCSVRPATAWDSIKHLFKGLT